MLQPPKDFTHSGLLPDAELCLTLTLSNYVLYYLWREMLEVHKPELEIVRELYCLHTSVDPLHQRASCFILLGDVYRCRRLFSQAKVVSSHLLIKVYM